MITIAIVSAARGETTALRGGQAVPLSEGSALEAGDVLVTGPDSGLTVRFNDDSVIDLSASTRVAVKDFLFEPEEQAFSLQVMEGVFRSVSGKIVERNPEAFEIASPLGVVGIRGTETLHIVSPKFEVHSVLSLDHGHTVFIRATDGRSIVISESLKGVILSVGDQSPLHEFDLTPQLLEDYLGLMWERGYLHHDPGGFFVLGDAAFLASLGAFDLLKNVAFLPAERLEALAHTLDAIDDGLGAVLLDRLDEPAITVDVDPTGMYREYTGTGQYYTSTPRNDTLILSGGGNNTLFAGQGDDSITVRFGDAGGNLIMGGYGSYDVITVERGIAGDTLLGDVQDMPAGVRGDDDIIILQGPMEAGGLICGDAENMKADSLDYASPQMFGGNDTLTVVGGMTGGTICGDALNAVRPDYDSPYSAPQVRGGHDVITVYDGMVGGEIFGDFDSSFHPGNAVCGNDVITVYGGLDGGAIYGDQRGDTAYAGNDVIHVVGDMTGGAIYGDDAHMVGMGSNRITVDGTMSAGSISGGGGADTISVGRLEGGVISAGGGDDSLVIGTYVFGASVDAGSGNDTLVFHDCHSTMGTPGVVSGGAGEDLGGGLFGPDNDLFVFNQPTSGDATLRISQFGTDPDGAYGWDRIDLSAFGAANVSIQSNSIVCTGSGGTLTLLLDNLSSIDQQNQLILS